MRSLANLARGWIGRLVGIALGAVVILWGAVSVANGLIYFLTPIYHFPPSPIKLGLLLGPLMMLSGYALLFRRQSLGWVLARWAGILLGIYCVVIWALPLSRSEMSLFILGIFDWPVRGAVVLSVLLLASLWGVSLLYPIGPRARR